MVTFESPQHGYALCMSKRETLCVLCISDVRLHKKLLNRVVRIYCLICTPFWNARVVNSSFDSRRYLTSS